MKHTLIGLTALMIATSAVQADDMIVAHPDSLKWGPAPAVVPKGAEIAVVTGDPSKAGSYVIRVKVPTNYQIPAHWHSTAENLTVLSGVVNVGMGDKLDKNRSSELEVGGFIFLPSKMNTSYGSAALRCSRFTPRDHLISCMRIQRMTRANSNAVHAD